MTSHPLPSEPDLDTLDAAWAAATEALPEGWALWGVRFRAPSVKRSRPRGQYEAWAGPVSSIEAPVVAWPRPVRGLSGYSSESPVVALRRLAVALADSRAVSS